VEFTDDFRVVADSGEGLTDGLEFLFSAGDEDEGALVGRGDIEAKAEVGEVGDGGLGGVAFGFVVRRDLVEGAGEVSAEGLVWAASAAGEFCFSVGSEEAEGGVFEPSVQEVAHDLLGLLTLVGIDADADKITAGFNHFFVAELTVLRCGVAGSKDA